MKPFVAAVSIAYLTFAVYALAQGPKPPSPTPPPGSPPGTPPGAVTAAPVDSFAAERDSLMKVVLAKIVGRENAPAESVFKNIRLFKGVPAGRLPRIMNIAFGKSLGVSCTHCHTTDDWADEAKPKKQVAREMWALMHTINDEMLPKIKNLKSEKPGINCTTCHRGSTKPAFNM